MTAAVAGQRAYPGQAEEPWYGRARLHIQRTHIQRTHIQHIQRAQQGALRRWR
jgi:hypothetical protein